VAAFISGERRRPLSERKEMHMNDQQTDLELKQPETERTEEDLEQVTEWARTCMFEGM